MRWLYLAAIAAILAGLGATYQSRRRALNRESPRRPASLPLELDSSARDWVWTHRAPGRTMVEVRAKSVKQESGAARIELENLELKIFAKPGGKFDLVKSARAEFFPAQKRLYSEGEVEITLGIPIDGRPSRQLARIRSSGVTFDSASGKATTERRSKFTFENGEGEALGASYDPEAKELHMRSGVVVDWKTPGSRPMKLEAGELRYREAEDMIWLLPWSRLTRENSVVDAASAVVKLEQGVIRIVEAQKARGADHSGGRRLQYSADQVVMNFSPRGEVERVVGDQNARLLATSGASATTISADHVELGFAAAGGESALARVLAHGNTLLESAPQPLAGRPLPETRLLQSQTIEMKMRAGGRDMDRIDTLAPAELQFLPNRPAQRRRVLNASRMSVRYAEGNRIESFEAVNALTRTDPNAEEQARNRPASVTQSKHLAARFDPATEALASLEQTGDFVYASGDRNARAATAVFEPGSEIMILESNARVWDASGATSADRIELEQASGDFRAQGHVVSSRQPDSNPGSGLLSAAEPVQARALRMASSGRNRLLRYEGAAELWQGANRIAAESIEIDRERGSLSAGGNVRTQFLETGKKLPGFTIVKSSRLVYTEKERLAHYTGGVHMNRAGLDMRSRELRAFLLDSKSGSQLERALADGAVEIVEGAGARVRKGSSEHAEYFTGEEKIVLKGGEPQLVDSQRGTTRGDELTYWAAHDRLVVAGAPEKPATSRIRRK
ncbi:MAG: LPS export ABC transporter periplasmic protein LptC [Acidobacteria bacterium]|nr:LPS export ABC transporter periplasmic protein LptC [Acidobacteriota bacterium]